MADPFQGKTRFRIKLDAMKYPYHLDLLELDQDALIRFIGWLEDTQIRSLPEKDRVPLKSKSLFHEWWKHLESYCQSLGYQLPMPVPSISDAGIIEVDSTFQQLLDWLAQRGISYCFQDNVDKFNEGNRKYLSMPRGTVQKSVAQAGKTKASFQFDDPEELRSHVTKLCEILQLPVHNEILINLAAVSRTLQFLCKAPNDPQFLGRAPSAKELLAQFPLGFQTGDAKLDAACKLLRVLYTADLRDLQDKIDEALVKLQNLTGDPRTDVRIGKVGSG